MKNILLCCNKMGIGGVETVILNQIVAFKSRGYNVYVMAEEGEYSKKVNELGGNFINIEFPEENSINQERVSKIVNIINEKNITEIHIHKYQCIPSVITAAYITNTPYYAYEHGIKDSKKYYTWNYPIYRFLFPIYFKNANKIIAITPKVAEITKNEYGFGSEKYTIVHNGIDFKLYYNSNPNFHNSIKNVFIVSRIDEEKLPTIYNGIKAFKKIKEIFPEAKLNIVGGGNAEQKVVKFLNESGLSNSYNDEECTVRLYGKQTDVIKYLKYADILLGVGRCVLEAIAMQIPVVITGYEGINGLVTEENIKEAMEENFSGINMRALSIEDFEKDILKLKDNRNSIINNVYDIAKSNLDCYNCYVTMDENEKLRIDWNQIFEIMNENIKMIDEQSMDIKLKYEWIQKIEKDNNDLTKENEKLRIENKNIIDINQQNEKKRNEEINALKNEINQIYNSKRWKYIEKVNNIFHRKNKAK